MKRIKNIALMVLTGLMPMSYFKLYLSYRSRVIIYVDMDGTVFNYKFQKEKYSKNHPQIQYPQSIEGFFDSMPAFDGAIEIIKELISSEKYDVYFLTAPSVENHLSYTEKRTCIEKHFGIKACKNLIISNDKSLSIGDILVDDCDSGRGQEFFLGKHIIYRDNWNHIRALLL